MLSIIVPHFRTPEFIRLCLRSLRKYSRGPVELIVVDNGSADGSLDYLRSLRGITLIENRSGSRGSLAQWEAMDLGIRRALGEWICLFHSDAIVLTAGWDLALLERAKGAGAIGLGTTVRDLNRFEPAGERLRRRFYEWRSGLLGRLRPAKGPVKLMSFCCLLRGDFLRGSGFTLATAPGDALSILYHQEIAGRHPFLLLGRRELEPLVWHTSNTTSIVTGQMADPRLVEKFARKSGLIWSQPEVQAILQDDTLDD
jgi:glycosyltransferase involved in cell wall biosynthesis